MRGDGGQVGSFGLESVLVGCPGDADGSAIRSDVRIGST